MLLFVMLLSWGWARPPQPLTPTKPTEDVDLIENLQDGRESEQVFAARELRRQVRLAIRHLYANDEVTVMEARQTLARFDESLAPICIDVVDRPNLTASCADILGALETPAALPILQDVLEDTTHRSTRRHLEAAITAINNRQEATP